MDINELNKNLKSIKISSDDEKNIKADCKKVIPCENNDEDEEKKKLKNIIKSLDIPFNWKPCLLGVKGKNLIQRFTDKLEEFHEDCEFKFRQ